jgi:hypothetical protein
MGDLNRAVALWQFLTATTDLARRQRRGGACQRDVKSSTEWYSVSEDQENGVQLRATAVASTT